MSLPGLNGRYPGNAIRYPWRRTGPLEFITSLGCAALLTGCSLSTRLKISFDWLVNEGAQTRVSEPLMLWSLSAVPVLYRAYGLDDCVPGCVSRFRYA